MTRRSNVTPMSPFSVIAFTFALFLAAAVPPIGMVLVVVAVALQASHLKGRRGQRRSEHQMRARAYERAIEADRSQRIAAARSLRA